MHTKNEDKPRRDKRWREKTRRVPIQETGLKLTESRPFSLLLTISSVLVLLTACFTILDFGLFLFSGNGRISTLFNLSLHQPKGNI